MNLLDKYRARLEDMRPKGERADETPAAPQARKTDTSHVCPSCHTFSWWLSIYNVLVCGVCHPPARSKFAKQWIGPGRAEEDEGRQECSRQQKTASLNVPELYKWRG